MVNSDIFIVHDVASCSSSDAAPGTTIYSLELLSVPQSPNLLNSARYHRVFQNFVVPWKIHISQKLILPADASRQDASNGVRVAYVNFYNMWVKNMVKD